MDTHTLHRHLLSHPEEIHLVRRWLQGDEEAFGGLWEAHQPGLLRYLRSRVRTAPRLDVDDVSQDVWLYVHQNLHKFDEAYEFGQFLFGLARNVVQRALSRKDPIDPVGGVNDLPEPGIDRSRRTQAAGAGPKPHPDFARLLRDRSEEFDPDQAAIFREMFELTFRCGGYPHQTLAFCFSIMVYGQTKREGSPTSGRVEGRENSPVRGNPGQVVKSLSDRQLGLLTDKLVEFSAAGMERNERAALEASAPIRERLCLNGEELFGRDDVSRRLFEDLAKMIIAETQLDAYYGKNPAKSVTDWTNAVKKRVRSRLDGSSSCARCVLPCEEGRENSG